MEFNWTIGLLYLIPIFLVVYFFLRSRKNWNTALKRQFVLGLSLKLLGSILFVLIYQFHFEGGDTFMYFRNIQSLNAVLYESPLKYLELLSQSQVYHPEKFIGNGYHRYWDISGVWMVIRMGSIFSFLGLNNFLGTTFLFACFSFCGMWLLFLALKAKYPSAQNVLFIAIFMIPSFIFWTSGLMKESLLFGMLGIFLSLVLTLNNGQKRSKFTFYFLLCSSLYVLIHVKQYIFYIVVLGFLLYSIMQWIQERSYRQLIPFFACILVAVVLSITWVEHRFVPLDWLDYAGDFYEYNMERSQKGEGLINEITNTDFSVRSVLTKAPKALISGLTQPYFWKCSNYLEYMASIEALVLLIVIIGSVLITIRKIGSIFEKCRWDAFMMYLFFCGLLLLLGVGIATPNIGSLVRYRSVALLFLLIPSALVWKNFNQIFFKSEKNEIAYSKRGIRDQ